MTQSPGTDITPDVLTWFRQVFLKEDQPESVHLLQSFIRDLAGETKFVWLSAKSTDALPIYGISRYACSLSIVGSAPDPDRLDSHHSIEAILKYRPDYDRVGLDQLSPSTFMDFLIDLGRHKSQKKFLIPFSPGAFISRWALCNTQFRLLANNDCISSAFDFKPWMESQLRSLALPVIPWTHHLCYDGNLIPPMTPTTSAVIRMPIATGGTGHQVLPPFLDVKASSIIQRNEIVSIAPFLVDHLSFNISACVNRNGQISVHPISLQIIGQPECSALRFSYCGNEFGTVLSYLSQSEVNEVECMTRRVGDLLRTYGYLGIFGIDFVKFEEEILISEVNPRFQASSILSSATLRALGLITPHEDHIAACIGYEFQQKRPMLYELCSMIEPLSQIFCYNTAGFGSDPILTDPSEFGADANDYVVDLPINSRPEENALLFRLFLRRPVLRGGRQLTSYASKLVSATREQYSFKTQSVS